MSGGTSLPIVERLAPTPDPLRVCEQLAGLPYRLLLDSAGGGPRLARFSFLMADPVAVIRSKGIHTEICDQTTGHVRLWNGDALTAVRALLVPHTVHSVPGVLPFQGGAAGYLAYDWGQTLERLPAPRCDDLQLWDAVLGIYDWVVAWDHERSCAFLISTGMLEKSGQDRSEKARTRLECVKARLRDSRTDSLASVNTRPAAWAAAKGFADVPSYRVDDGWFGGCSPPRSTFTHDGYLDVVSRVREYIVAGDIFQANLSQRFESALSAPPWALYLQLRQRSPAPFAAFMDLPDAAIVSASPERFLRVDGAGHVETRPVKGTRPRAVDPVDDEALGVALLESAKDRAEHLMIVDLLRNDLSRVCSPGTVRVSELLSLERHPTVQHLVSTIVGTLEGGLDVVDLLRATFPGGSITGAPKIRAMEIIAQLEPSARAVYCGSIGYWSVTGELDMNIAIRTAVAVNGRVYFGAGGGIVADSDPQQEYVETLDKARAFIEALASLA